LGFLAIGNFFTNADTDYDMGKPLINPNEFRYGWYYIDDVKVRILNPQIPDTVRVCKGDVAELIATGEENHQWAFAHSPGQIEGTDSIFTYYPDSSQTVLFYGSFDTLTTYVHVDELAVDLGADTVICAGDDFWLQGPASADSYLWSTGSTAAQVPITQTGTYWLQASKGMCTKTDSIYVDVVDLANLTIQSPALTCLGDDMTLWVKPQPYATYLWNTGQTDTAITITEDGLYSVTVTNPCGTATASKEAVFEKCVCHFYLPNAFSPNGDGVNDEFYPVFDCSIRNYLITITDRWGNVVFTSTNPDERWQGQNAQPGVYSVHVFYQGLNEEGQTVGDDLVQMLMVIK
jgi:gliding motility-associated-like protein